MKKNISLILAMLMLLGVFAGCSSEPEATVPSTDAPTQPSSTETEPTLPEPEPITLTLGDRMELLVDDYLFESSENVVLARETPVDRGSVYTFDGVNEGDLSSYATVMENPLTGEYWMYYRGLSTTDDTQYTCLAISKDGVNFEPAVLEDGTNVIMQHKMYSHNFAPFYDTNPNCVPGEEFKAVAYTKHFSLMGGEYWALYCFYSPDGIHWTQYRNARISGGLFDSLNTAFWDSTTGQYICYARYSHMLEDRTELRAIQRYTSEDFLIWSAYPESNTYNGGNEPIYEYYTNAIRPVPGAEHILVGIPMRANFSRQKVESHSQHGVSDCVMITSRDGNDWYTTDEKAWIYPGLSEREWTDRNFIVAPGMLVIDDEFNFYVQKDLRWDTNYMCRYTVPKYRLGYAYSADGTITTKPFIMEAEEYLTFNYKTSAMGTLRVTVLDEAGQEVQTCEIYGNELEYKMEIPGMQGQILQLVIELEDAYLYAIGGQ